MPKLALCLLLICQGLALLLTWTARAQETSRPKKGETPTISQGALADLEAQNAAQAGLDSSGVSNALSGMAAAASMNMLAAASNQITAINFDENAAQTGFFQIPPDPAGAVGPAHLVNVNNSSIEFYTKAGVRDHRQSLKNFFATATTPPVTGTFDPKVVYDHYANRFIVVTMERIEAAGATPNQSRVYLAVSDDSDPNGTWFFHTLLTEEVINGRQSWADFPGLAIDSEAVYFTTNMFAHNNQTQAGVFQGQRLWILAKAPWYTGGAAVATIYNPTALANAVPGTEGAVATTMQPTIMFDDMPGGVGTYLLAYSGLSDGINNFVQVIRVDNPLAAPTFTVRFSLVGTRAAADATNLALPPAPQLGTNRTIATNDRRFSQNGVFRNGLIYCAAPIRPPVGPDANQTTAHYFIINPVTIDTAPADPPPVDQGNIGAENVGAGTHTFFPTVAVDPLGNMAIGFAASGPNIYPGAYYTGRLAGDLAGATQLAGVLRAGEDYYVRAFSTSMSPAVTSRWGDYTGIGLDPTDGTTFWAFNEYALPRGTILPSVGAHEDGRWGTAWGSFGLQAQANLSVTKTDSPDPVQAGALITYTITLTNNGPSDAADVFLNDNIPANTTLVSAMQTSGVTFNPASGGGSVSWSIATFGAGQTATFSVVVSVNCSTPNGSIISNTASVTTSTTDPDTTNNMSTATTTVLNPAPVFIQACPAPITAVTPPTCPVQTGVVVMFPTPTASDAGDCPVTVTCDPPSGAIFPVGTTTVTCTATDAANQTVSCMFTVTVFNACIQDDTVPGKVILFNTITGEYRACCGSGLRLEGTGTVTRQGCVYTLQHNAPDRRITARIDFTVKKGNGSIQTTPGNTVCTITDRDSRNNSCQCELPVPR